MRERDLRDAATDQRIGRILGGTDRHVGIPFRESEHEVRERDLDVNSWMRRAKLRQDVRQNRAHQRVGGGDAHGAGKSDILPGQSAFKTRHRVLDVTRGSDELLTAGGRDIAGCQAAVERPAHSMAPEQTHVHIFVSGTLR
jgi:hypothetical protein